MSHGTGRHRRRRRDWANRTRRAVSAVLATIIGAESPPPPGATQTENRKPPPRRESRRPESSPPEREPEWIRRYDEARRTHTDRWTLFTEGSEGAEAGAPPELPELGWCVDEDGVRAVRPYLVAHEQRQRAKRRRVAPRDSHQADPARSAPVKAVAPNVPGEWDELAGLIRQWDALRVPVA